MRACWCCLLLTSLVSPGFLSPSHLRSLTVLAAFTGLVALGQTLVIIGGGIDLSVPWVLNSAAVLVTLMAGGPRRAAALCRAAAAGRRRAGRCAERVRHRALRRAAHHHDARRQRHPAGRHPGLYRRRADRDGAAADPVARGRPPRSDPDHRADLGGARGRRFGAALQDRLRPLSLRDRHERHGGRIFGRADRCARSC